MEGWEKEDWWRKESSLEEGWKLESYMGLEKGLGCKTEDVGIWRIWG